MMGNDICIAGLPRSGTTLLCQLVNRMADGIALHEPLKANKLAKLQDRDRILNAIETIFRETRQSILETATFTAKTVRLDDFGTKTYRIRKPLSADFVLCIKQPAFFSALLPVLPRRFRCVAVIRNPLAVLCSWNRVEMSVRQGHSPAAEKLDRRLRAELAACEDAIERQLALLNWYFAQFYRLLPPECILRYEEIVETRGACLHVISPSAVDLPARLAAKNFVMVNKNRNANYDPVLKYELANLLLKSENACWHFYSRDQVQALLDNTRAQP